MKQLIVVVLTMILVGCVSPQYCDETQYGGEINYAKCTAAVAADVVLVAGAVVLVAAAAGAGGSSSNNMSYADPCVCPDDIAADGSICGDRSAWSRVGGDKPYCEGYGWGS